MVRISFYEAYLFRLKHTIDNLGIAFVAETINVIRTGWQAGQQFIAFDNEGSGLAAQNKIGFACTRGHSRSECPF